MALHSFSFCVAHFHTRYCVELLYIHQHFETFSCLHSSLRKYIWGRNDRHHFRHQLQNLKPSKIMQILRLWKNNSRHFGPNIPWIEILIDFYRHTNAHIFNEELKSIILLIIYLIIVIIFLTNIHKNLPSSYCHFHKVSLLLKNFIHKYDS